MPVKSRPVVCCHSLRADREAVARGVVLLGKDSPYPALALRNQKI